MKLVLMQAHHIPLTINILKYTKLDEHIGRSVSMYAEIFFPSLLTLRRMSKAIIHERVKIAKMYYLTHASLDQKTFFSE